MANDDCNEFEEDAKLFDSVCSICDNGGEILCCEGRCLRSFHATRDASVDCASLGYTSAQVEAIPIFLCKNCRYKKHQCFACGKLGSSDETYVAEVFPCVSATCGHFYHSKCVAELLFPENAAEATECAENIASGRQFTCPVHRCSVCGHGENKEVKDLQFAVCRRCPKAYHRKCLPRKIALEASVEEGIMQRVWDNLLPSRILIYCLKHPIDENIGTPVRDHILFPILPAKEKMRVVEPKVTTMGKTRHVRDMVTTNPSLKATKKTIKLSGVKKSYSLVETDSQVLDRKRVKSSKGTAQHEARNNLKASECSYSLTSNAAKYVSSFPVINDMIGKKICTFMKEISSTLTVEDIRKDLVMPSTYSFSARLVDKSITKGKVEGAVEGIKAALQKLENGGSIEDAKAVCEPSVISQIVKWRNNLKVYLAPFLHGMRYTSYGRHFTKVDKLKEIVGKVQCYVEKGDMVVDFCCGANDFSILMKEKLEAVGKKCFFRNYDLIQPKNDFNFERRDWLEVQPDELPTGSRLIMGLNPPFGVKAALANKFINKALTFKPKLLILIVPGETDRLDVKDPRYDLIWQDSEKLSGKSFYLPGSVDTNDKQMEQWNLKPPPLSLWSRPDWTMRHMEIARRHGHLCKEHDFSDEDIQREEPAEQLIDDVNGERHSVPEDRQTRNKSRKRSSETLPERNIEDFNEQLVTKNTDELSDMSISSPDRSVYQNHIDGVNPGLHLVTPVPSPWCPSSNFYDASTSTGTSNPVVIAPICNSHPDLPEQLKDFSFDGSIGFAPGPSLSLRHGSCGWLDD